MGGIGSGGRRPGAGRKPKDAVARALDGGAGHRGKVLPHPSAPPAAVPVPVSVVDEADAPDYLTFEERQWWVRLRPHARAAGTLTPATESAFELLCRNYALERRFAISPMDAGTANHRGLIQRVQADLSAFNIRPAGKPMPNATVATAAPAADPRKAKYLGSRRS